MLELAAFVGKLAYLFVFSCPPSFARPLLPALQRGRFPRALQVSGAAAAFAFVSCCRRVVLDRLPRIEWRRPAVECWLFVDWTALLKGLFLPARLLSATATVFGTLSCFVHLVLPRPQQSERACSEGFGLVLLLRYAGSMHPQWVRQIGAAVARRHYGVARDLGLPVRNQEFAPGVSSLDLDRTPSDLAGRRPAAFFFTRRALDFDNIVPRRSRLAIYLISRRCGRILPEHPRQLSDVSKCLRVWCWKTSCVPLDTLLPARSTSASERAENKTDAVLLRRRPLGTCWRPPYHRDAGRRDFVASGHS